MEEVLGHVDLADHADDDSLRPGPDGQADKHKQVDKPRARPRPKVMRRDPEKRRQQNRLAQKTYREKQRKRVQELERMAGQQNPVEAQSSSGSSPDQPDTPGPLVLRRDSAAAAAVVTAAAITTIDPRQLEAIPAATSPTTICPHHHSHDGHDDVWNMRLLSPSFDAFLTEASAGAQDYVAFFNCGCPVLHIPQPHNKAVLLPVTTDPYRNALGIDVICVISALLDNCLQLGITRTMLCGEEDCSPFYRQDATAVTESASLVPALQHSFRGLHYDLRPTERQILVRHHPYIDVIPFREVRDSLIAHMEDMDEDDFFHDALSHLKCWGSIAGSHTGTPWDCRSWEASEVFLQKWSHVVGGDEGELARQSRWWRSLRGERVTEVLR